MIYFACTLEAAFVGIAVSTIAEKALVCVARRFAGLLLADKTGLRHCSLIFKNFEC